MQSVNYRNHNIKETFGNNIIIKYKNVEINNIFQPASNMNNDVYFGSYSFMLRDGGDIAKNIPFGATKDGVDISDLASARYEDCNYIRTSYAIQSSFNFKSISAVGWGAGGGEGGRGGQGRSVRRITINDIIGKVDYHSGGNGGTGVLGSFFAISKYPIVGNKVNLVMGEGGTPGWNGADANNDNKPGVKGGDGYQGKTTTIKVGNTTIVSVDGSSGGGGGNGANQNSAGTRGTDANTEGTVTYADNYNTYNGNTGNINSENVYRTSRNTSQGRHGFVRIYFHYD